MPDGKLVGSDRGSIADTVANSAIMAGLNFFTTLAGIATQTGGTLTTSNFLAAGIAAGLAFFSSLAIQRGLKKEEAG